MNDEVEIYIMNKEELKLFGIFLEQFRLIFSSKCWQEQTIKFGEEMASLGVSQVDRVEKKNDDKNYYVASPIESNYIVISPELALKIFVLGGLP